MGYKAKKEGLMFMETIKVIFEVIFLGVYCWFGYKSIVYIKYHLMGVQAEYTSDISQFYLDRFTWGVLLGWITIPIMIIGKMMGK